MKMLENTILYVLTAVRPIAGIQKSKVAVWIGLLAIFGTHMVRAGENVWTSLGPDGGAVSALVIDPQNTSTVYAGTGNGVFKSTDGGASWRTVNAGLPGSSWVVSLVIDPHNTTTLYAWINYYGVFKTTNGGTSWIPAGSGLPAYSVDFLALPGLVIDPHDSETLYAAAGEVYKTTDGGKSWNVANLGLPRRTCCTIALAVDPQNTGTVYAVTGTDYFSRGVFRTTDGGASWSQVSADLNGTPINPGPFVETLLVDPKTSSTLYAGTRDAGIWKSTDAGVSWAAANSGMPNGSRILGLALDPQNPSTLYAVLRFGVFQSTDGGTTWLGSIFGITESDFDPRDNCGCGSTNLGLGVDPTNPGTVYVGTYGGGILKSAGDGTHWNRVNVGLRAVGGSSIAIDSQDPRTLYYASSRRVYKSVDAGMTWSAGAFGLGVAITALSIDPRTAGVIYVGSSEISEWGLGNIYKSVDGGISLRDTGFKREWGGIWTLAIDPRDSSTVYAGADHGMYKTSDGGLTWDLKSPSDVGQVFYIALDSQNPGTIYIGHGRGGGAATIHKSTDGGESWNALRSGLPDCCIYALAVDPQDPGTVYAGFVDVYPTYDAAMFKSTDGGANWKPLIPFPKGNVVIDPENPGTLYVGTNFGVFRSMDAGESWSALNAGLPPGGASVTLDPKDPNTLYASTSGGAFVITLAPDRQR